MYKHVQTFGVGFALYASHRLSSRTGMFRLLMSGSPCTRPVDFLHVPVCSDFWCLVRLVRVPWTFFTYQNVKTFGV